MILSDTAILAAMTAGDIIIEPFDITQLGGNSYDVRLAPTLLVTLERPLDAAYQPVMMPESIPDSGRILDPGRLYLGSTIEYTETHRHVPYLDGKSGVGRLGISIHATAGRGDVGFCGHFTLEISVVEPVRVYPFMLIGQLTYHLVAGDVERKYNTKPGASYTDARDPLPQASRLWRKMAGN